MSLQEKEEPTEKPDPALAAEINQQLKDGMLPCAVAHDIARNLEVDPLKVGQAADALEISLSKCQLGLFGYKPNKRSSKPRLTHRLTFWRRFRLRSRMVWCPAAISGRSPTGSAYPG